MDIDPHISNWVLEFFLRQPLDDDSFECTLNSLLRTLPLPKNNHHLQKCILLRKLESQVSRNSISERTLDLIEQLEEIEFRQGNLIVSDSMKRAYCAVAVETTVKRLFASGDDGSLIKFKFFEAVKRVWRGKIGKMEKMLEKKGLYSEELWGWKDEIEAAVWEDVACESVVKKSESVDAVLTVNDYLREEREKMGPSFLELAAKKVDKDEGMKGVLGLGSDHQEAAKDANSCPVDGALGDNVTNEIPKKSRIQLRDKLVGLRRVKSLKRAKIVDPEETTIDPSRYDLPDSAKVNRVREALGSSSLELQAVVKDPLPEALKFADKISEATMKDKDCGPVKEKDKDNDPVKENHVEDDLLLVDSAGVVHGSGSNASNVHKPSLMERNSSAHTYEWDESIDGSEEDGGRPQLPSPRLITNSPLNRHEVENVKRPRRKARKWSLLEEDTLRTEVQKYGKGCWKYILTLHPDIFENRTEVDLKDKWRNMTR